jgi:hypothetical protein
MMMRRASMVLFGLLIAVPSASEAGQRIKPIHPEREHWRPSARRAVLLDDLSTILKGPTSPTSITSIARAVDGQLCKRTVITLEYEGFAGESSKHSPKPIGIGDVYAEYHNIGYPGKLPDNQADDACRLLDSNKDDWALGHSEHMASSGLYRLKQIAAMVRAGQNVRFDCTEVSVPVQPVGGCAAEFLDAADHPHFVGICDESGRQASGECFVYGLREYLATVRMDWRGNANPIGTVKLEPMPIVVT